MIPDNRTLHEQAADVLGDALSEAWHMTAHPNAADAGAAAVAVLGVVRQAGLEDLARVEQRWVQGRGPSQRETIRALLADVRVALFPEEQQREQERSKEEKQ